MFNRTIELSVQEEQEISRLVDAVFNEGLNEDYRLFFNKAFVLATKMPERIISELYNFKFQQDLDTLLIKKNPSSDTDIGLTPRDYRNKDDFKINKAEVIHGLYSIILGEPFGFDTQRNGHCYNRIIPVPQLEDVANSSSGYKHRFEFHTEDAFHFLKPDVLGLVCMRNLEKAKTAISSLRASVIPDEYKSILFENRFEITNNYIHQGVKHDYGKQAILYGSNHDPYLTVNFANLDISKCNKEEQNALNWLKNELYKNSVEYILEQGDCFYINNRYAVHARDSYAVEFTGYSRWLSRLCVTFDLGKSIKYRNSPTSRVIEQNIY